MVAIAEHGGSAPVPPQNRATLFVNVGTFRVCHY